MNIETMARETRRVVSEHGNCFWNYEPDFARLLNTRARISILLSVLALLTALPTFAESIAGPKETTLRKLDTYYKDLQEFKQLCGRYPTAKEGLEVFLLKPCN